MATKQKIYKDVGNDKTFNKGLKPQVLLIEMLAGFMPSYTSQIVSK
ncbi:MAG: hypothetical protein ACYTXA_24910 [Nostoc sp.]